MVTYRSKGPCANYDYSTYIYFVLYKCHTQCHYIKQNFTYWLTCLLITVLLTCLGLFFSMHRKITLNFKFQNLKKSKRNMQLKKKHVIKSIYQVSVHCVMTTSSIVCKFWFIAIEKKCFKINSPLLRALCNQDHSFLFVKILKYNR